MDLSGLKVCIIVHCFICCIAQYSSDNVHVMQPVRCGSRSIVGLHQACSTSRIHRSTSDTLTMPESNAVEEQEIGLVSVDYFFSYLLPRIPEDKSFSVEAVMAD